MILLTKEQKIALLQAEKSVLEKKVSILEIELRKIQAQEFILNKKLSDESPKVSVKTVNPEALELLNFEFLYEHFYEIQNLFFEELSYLDLQSEKSKLLQRELCYFQDTCLIRHEVLFFNFNQLWNNILKLNS